MLNNIYNKVKQWITRRRDWVILGTAGILAIALIVGVIFVIVDKPSDKDPVKDTTVGVQTESVEQTGEEDTTAPSETEGTISGTEETTVPEETTSVTEPTEETTKPAGAGQEDGNSSGAGFTDQAPPQGSTSTETTPTTPVTPEQTEPKNEPEETMTPEKPVQEYTYKEYLELKSEEKTKFFYKFPSLSEFNKWYNAAKKAYDEEKLVIGDSSIDLGELLKP